MDLSDSWHPDRFLREGTGLDAKSQKGPQYWPGEKYKFEIRVGIGPHPILFRANYPVEDNYMIGYGGNRNALHQIYGESAAQIHCAGSYALEFGWNLKKWLNLSFMLYSTIYYGKEYYPIHAAQASPAGGATSGFMPQLRFYYLNREKVRLYSGFGIGFSLDTFRRHEVKVHPAVDLTLFGLTFGKRVFGFAELGGGSSHGIIKAGIGYNF